MSKTQPEIRPLTAIEIIQAQAEYYRVVQKTLSAIDWSTYKPNEIPNVMAKYISEVFGQLAFLTNALLQANYVKVEVKAKDKKGKKLMN